MLKFLRVPFAQSGDRAAVPDAPAIGGDVSYTEGYGADYSRPKTDPLSKNIEREKMNQIFFDATTAIGELQAQGLPDFITPLLNGGVAFSYAKNAVVRYNNQLYISLVDANTSLPTDITKWLPFFAPSIRVFGPLNNDGVTDDSATWQAAAASGVRFIDATGLNCRIDAQIDIAPDQVWLVAGTRVATDSSTLTVFKATNIDNWAIVGPMKIVGTAGTVGTAKGIHVVGGHNWRVDNLTCELIKGHGFYVEPGTSLTRSNHGHFINPRAIGCYRGWEDVAGTGAEYSTVVSPYIKSCTQEGFITSAGNTIVFGGQILECLDGVRLNPGSNHGHGIFVGTQINHHNRYSVYGAQVLNGHTFSACHIYANDNAGAGAIFLDRCKGIVFDAGQLDAWVYNDKDGSSGYNYIRGMYCPGSYGPVIVAVGPNPGADQLVITECYGVGSYSGSTSINDPSPVYTLAERLPAASQALTSGVNTTLIWPTKVFDRRLAYDDTTGLFTVPAGQAGVYRINAHGVISGATVTADVNWIELQVNGNPSRLAAPTRFNPEKFTFLIQADLKLNAGDVVRVQANFQGTTLVFRDSSWTSGLSIERIA